MCRPKSDSKKLTIIAQGFFTFFFKQRCLIAITWWNQKIWQKLGKSHWCPQWHGTQDWQNSSQGLNSTDLCRRYLKCYKQEIITIHCIYKLHRNLDARHTEWMHTRNECICVIPNFLLLFIYRLQKDMLWYQTSWNH